MRCRLVLSRLSEIVDVVKLGKDLSFVAVEIVWIAVTHLTAISADRMLLPLSLQKHLLVLTHLLALPDLLHGRFTNISEKELLRPI